MGNNLSIHAKPILKWAGGKSQMLKYILPLIPNYSGRYIEPFLGGGAVYFALNPDNAIISDSNPELINMYRQVADNVESVITYLNKYKNDKELFYAVREQVWENLPKAEAAARMIFLNKTCFNGLYRVNKKGMFNTPFGNYKNPIICDEDRLRNASKILSKATLVCGDYGDMNMRYLRASGVLQRKGRGIQIIDSKHLIVEKLAKTSFSTEPYISHMMELVQGAVLPTDNVNDAISILNDLKNILKQSNIYFDISDMSLNTVSEINMARRKLENILAQTNEELYARKQRDEWKEISDYMTLLIRGGGKIQYDEDNMIEVPKDETPAYLEWIMWRALLAIDHLNNPPSEVRGFKLDADFLPVNAAGGGKGDLYCVFDNYVILTEVTMSTSSRQEAMEGEPVRRHVSDAVINYTKPVYCMFIANKVNMNTAETFRHGVWYTNLIKKQRLNIVPLTLKQFKDYFDYLFNSNQAEPDRIVDLLDTCICKRDAMEAPIWMDYIDKLISEKELINQKSCKFPFGVYFGSHIFDNVDKATGIVVGMNDDYILVAYENTFEPKIITYDRLAFENNVCKIA